MRFAILSRILVILLAASWLGCGGEGGVTNDQNPPPPSPTLQFASVSPIGPAVTVGGTVQLTVTGDYSDNSTKDLTSSATYSSTSPLVSVSNTGLVSGLAAGVGSITVSYGGLFSETMAVNVTTMTLNNSLLQGNYVFTYNGSDPLGSHLVVGVFVADGLGKIIGGQIDSNSSSGVVSTAIPSGSYTVFPDGRGTLTLQPASPLSAQTYRFVLSQDGSSGHLMTFDGIRLGIGTLEKQAPSLDFSSFQGNYAFRMGGYNQANSPSTNLALIGILAADGTGNISSGQVHINDNGTIDNGTVPPAAVTFIGTYNGPGPGGRGTATLDAGAGPMNFAFYFVSPSKAYFLEIDTANSQQVLLGPMEKQTGVPFSPASATGGYVFLSENAGLAGSFAISGQAMLNGLGAILGGVQVEVFGTGPLAEAPVLSGSYNIASDGSASVSWNLDFGGPRSFLGYMVSPTKMFVLQTAPSGWVSAGTAERQMTGPFDLASVKGTFLMSMSQLQPAGTPETTTGQLIADGAGNLTGISDLNEFMGYGTGALSATYSFPSDHAALGQGMALVSGEDFYFYMISPTKLVIFHDNNPAAIGVVEIQ